MILKNRTIALSFILIFFWGSIGNARANEQMHLRNEIQKMRTFCYETTEIYSNAFYELSQKKETSNQEMISVTENIRELLKKRELNIEVAECKENRLCEQVKKYAKSSTKCTQEGINYLSMMLGVLKSSKEIDLDKLFDNKRQKLAYLQSTHGLDYNNLIKEVPLDLDARNFSFFMYTLYGEMIKVVDSNKNGSDLDPKLVKAALLKAQKRSIDSTDALAGFLIIVNSMKFDDETTNKVSNKIRTIRSQFQEFSDESIEMVMESANSLKTENAAGSLLENIEFIVISEKKFRYSLRSYRDTVKEILLIRKRQMAKVK